MKELHSTVHDKCTLRGLFNSETIKTVRKLFVCSSM